MRSKARSAVYRRHAQWTASAAGVCLCLGFAGAAAAANLALNKPATGSASCNGNETPAKAVNGSVSGGNADKFCSSASSKWLQVDLGASKRIASFVVRHAGAGGEPAAFNTRNFNIQVSADGSAWTTAATVSNNTDNVTTHNVGAVDARYARLNIATPTQGSDSAARIYEFEAHDAAAPAERVVLVLDQVPQFGIYRSTEPTTYTPPPGLLMWKRGTEFARKLSDAEKAGIGDDVALRITYHAQCDPYDRFASAFFINLPKGQTPTVDTPRVTFTDFISPFSDMWQGAKATRVYPDAAMDPYAAALANPDRDIWVGISGGSNPQYGSDACQQHGVTDPAIAEVGFKYSLALVSKKPLSAGGDPDVISLLSRSPETDDSIATGTVSHTANLGIATLAVSIAGYGASSGGQEYTNTNVSVKFNGAQIATFSTKIDCASYEQYSPRGNPGIFRNNNTSNPRSWCPGALVPMRYFDLGDISGKTLQFTLGVGNRSPWTADSVYNTSISVLEH
ncbi:discoidin domain-containing protein [Lysobacter enzymogenes]|uniref:discoidin domain-containing protein n=1 Tax=Lysobacter enzymogenes TaxID=69 RepID=UPI001A971E87|nr:discoidin domain-containing protein [Lysobacter enzymogenes]QQP97884.1 discoidin domain-containing protein [Lysobacter enzymogenes]